jgi:membrane protein YdbS with pleckstrin-like domain
LPPVAVAAVVPRRVERSDPEGVDFGWVMQVTFVTTILVGAPTVAVLSAFVTLPTWAARVEFAVRVGAVVWVLVAVAVYLYARRTGAGDGGEAAGESGEAVDSEA